MFSNKGIKTIFPRVAYNLVSEFSRSSHFEFLDLDKVVFVFLYSFRGQYALV